MDRSIVIIGIMLLEIVKMMVYIFLPFKFWTLWLLQGTSPQERLETVGATERQSHHTFHGSAEFLPTALPRGLPSQEEERRSSRRADCLALKGGFQDGNVVHSLTLPVAK